MAPVSNHTYADSGLPNIYSSSAPNTARSAGPKESRFDANSTNYSTQQQQRQQVWGARPAPPQQQRGPDAAPPRTSSNGSGDGDAGSGFSLPALAPRISAVTLPTSTSAPLPGSNYHDASHQEPSSAPPQSSIPNAASVGGFTPSPPSARVQSGGRSPIARPTVGNTPTVTAGAAAAFADLENENKLLEEIFEDAKDIIGVEREMKKAGGEYVIQKRLTSTYEIAAHLGIESQALAPTTQRTYQLKDPHSLLRTGSPDSSALPTPRQVGTSGALAPSNVAMRRLSLAPFLNPENSPLLSGRRTNLVSSPTTTPRTPLSSITTSTPRRYDPAGDKSRYAQLFAEQNDMEKKQQASTVQYQSMLETYFKLQEEMKKKLDADPWEMGVDDFEDKTVMNLKRRLSQLVGIPFEGLDEPAVEQNQPTSQEE